MDELPLTRRCTRCHRIFIPPPGSHVSLCSRACRVARPVLGDHPWPHQVQIVAEAIHVAEREADLPSCDPDRAAHLRSHAKKLVGLLEALKAQTWSSG